METSLTLTSESVKTDQQGMIRFLESKGITPKILASDYLYCSPVMVRAVKSDATTTRFTTEPDLKLRHLCAEHGCSDWVEMLLPVSMWAAPRPVLHEPNGCVDELLEYLRVLATIRDGEARRDGRAVLEKADEAIRLGFRLRVEAYAMIDDERAGDRPAVPHMCAESAPLFDYVGDGR